MNYTSKDGGIQVLLDDKLGRLMFTANRNTSQEVSLWAADNAGGAGGASDAKLGRQDMGAGKEAMFCHIKEWEVAQQAQLDCVKFTAGTQQTAPSVKAEYRIYIDAKEKIITVATKIIRDAQGQENLPIDWMRFSINKAVRVRCMQPAWETKEELTRPVSCKDGLVIDFEESCIGFFNGGEPLYDPIANFVCPDAWALTTGVAGFETWRKATFVFGEKGHNIDALCCMANKQEKQVAELLLEENAKIKDKKIQTKRLVQEHEFSHGDIGFVLAKADDGIWIAGMKSFEGENIAYELPILRIELEDISTGNAFVADSREGWDSVELYASTGFGRIQLQGLAAYPELCAEISFSFQSEGRIEWKTDILNGETSLTVLTASYPPMPFSGEAIDCFIPEHCGWVAQNVTKQAFYRDGVYPRGWRFTMAYFAAWATKDNSQNQPGLYYGLHDADGAFKSMFVQTDPLQKRGLFYATAHAPNIGMGGNAFSLPGSLVWESFKGDWYDATQLYKAFVHKEAKWLPEKGENGRIDTPQWAKELPIWVMDWMPNMENDDQPIPPSIGKEKLPPADYWYKEPVRRQKKLGVPLGYHVYKWHQIPFNNDYPHYFPENPAFTEKIEFLKENGIRVMPYINARLWDMRDHGGDDRLFAKKGQAGAVKERGGKFVPEVYTAKEPDGSDCLLSPMCPSSAVWKTQMTEVVSEMCTRLGVDGVYEDQISASSPCLCADKNHPHPAGGGAWWSEQYSLMLQRHRQVKGPDKIITSEDNAEVYIKHMDGVLSWIWNYDNLVPAYPSIYAGYVIMFGRSTNGVKKHDYEYLKYQNAEQFVFGGQLGWMNADVSEQSIVFLRKLAQLRYRYAEYFYKGVLHRPPVIETNLPIKVTLPAYLDTRLFEARRVLGGVWSLADGQTRLFLINCDEGLADFSLQLPDFAGFEVRKIEGQGDVSKAVTQSGTLRIQGVLEEEGVLVLSLEKANYTERTEDRNIRTAGLDKLSTKEALLVMNEENKIVPNAVQEALEQIALLVDHIAENMLKGGRLIYVGAGTSGRIASMDAVECPPTFGVPSGSVVALIAGGQTALTTALPEKEDDPVLGKADMQQLNPGQLDTVLGISASGNPEYVIAAMKTARAAGATTASLCCNHGTKMAKEADYPIVVLSGAEAICGSTRLKAANAQKIVLNLISTEVMVKQGYVLDNFMVNFSINNKKLLKRAVDIIVLLTECSEKKAENMLQEFASVREAVEKINKEKTHGVSDSY